MLGGYRCFLLRGAWKAAKHSGASSSSRSRKPRSSVRPVASASLHFRDSDDDQEMEDVAEMHRKPQQEAHGLPPPDHHRWDVVGLGQAMVGSVLLPFLVCMASSCRLFLVVN